MVKTTTKIFEFVPIILANNEQNLTITIVFINLSLCCIFSMHLYSGLYVNITIIEHKT